jgi:hypothetical protein
MNSLHHQIGHWKLETLRDRVIKSWMTYEQES